jgi:protein O-mannosyl-transferase
MTSEHAEYSSRLKRILPIAAIAILIAATVAAYSPILQNLFNGDDYAHLAWVYKAAADPKLVLQNFYSSWMGVFTTFFYRPLCAVFMYTDYCIWGSNAFGYHLTSLLFHLAASTAVGLLTYELAGGSKETKWIWTIAAAGLFALYPIHPEASTWIACRGDVLSTLFCVSSVWCFARWNRIKNRWWYAASVFCYVLGLCSKESAVTIPAILLLYSILVRKDGIFIPLRNTFPFWLTLAAYFQVRYISFGTFLGGYSSALGSDPILTYMPRWLHSLRVMFIPFNFELINHRSDFLPILVWVICLATSLISLAVLAVRDSELRRQALFLLGWTALTIIPILKFFWLKGNFEGTRNVYISTAPLCMCIVLGLSYLGKPRLIRYASIAALCALVSIAGIWLYDTNKTWEEAGIEMRSFTQAVNELYRSHPNPPLFYFAGVPNEIHGAAAGINAVDALMRPPYLDKVVNYGGYFAPGDKTFTFGARRQNFVAGEHSPPVVYLWNTEKKEILPTKLEPDDGTYEVSWNSSNLASLLQREREGGSERGGERGRDRGRGRGNGRWGGRGGWGDRAQAGDDGLIIKSGEHDFWNPTVVLNFQDLKPDSWKAQILTLKFDFLGGKVYQEPPLVAVQFENSLQPEFKEVTEEVAMAPGGNGEVVTIPMRGNAYWSLGGDCRRLKISFPRGWNIRLTDVAFSGGAKQIPSIQVDPKLKEGREGMILASAMGDSCQIAFDTSNVPGATKTLLEITEANTPFGLLNSPNLSDHTSRTLTEPNTKGTFEIDRKDFPASGIYQLRVRGLDENGKPVGLASDHVILMNTTIQ